MKIPTFVRNAVGPLIIGWLCASLVSMGAVSEARGLTGAAALAIAWAILTKPRRAA